MNKKNLEKSREQKRAQWLSDMIAYLRKTDLSGTPQDMGRRIHWALQIAEAEKYAEPGSRFTFEFSDATEEDLAEIRTWLTPFENSIVKLERK